MSKCSKISVFILTIYLVGFHCTCIYTWEYHVCNRKEVLRDCQRSARVRFDLVTMLSCLIRLKNCMNLQLKSQKLQKWINVQSVEESEHIMRLWYFLTWCQSRSRQISVTCLLHILWDQVPNIPENILGSFACAVKDKMWIL